MSRILVVEDEPAIADTVEYALSTEGMTVVRVGTLHAARQHLLSQDLSSHSEQESRPNKSMSE